MPALATTVYLKQHARSYSLRACEGYHRRHSGDGRRGRRRAGGLDCRSRRACRLLRAEHLGAGGRAAHRCDHLLHRDFPEAAAKAAGKRPVLALMPVPGELDIVIASELMEAGRAIQRGLVTPDRTTLIASTQPRLFDDGKNRDCRRPGRRRRNSSKRARARPRSSCTAILRASSERCGSVISAALFGALAAHRRAAVHARAI